MSLSSSHSEDSMVSMASTTSLTSISSASSLSSMSSMSSTRRLMSLNTVFIYTNRKLQAANKYKIDVAKKHLKYIESINKDIKNPKEHYYSVYAKNSLFAEKTINKILHNILDVNCRKENDCYEISPKQLRKIIKSE
ncbi:ORF-105 peptide [Chrysodeixis chalcites nucleopolyhedrovirus]|uniref:ORF-105 peptide n=1 Tax=Chrysodeixis chalcites nucleopolyhedrovirus TaxID=320432 RepID=Q4KSX5_9ABAC|nr:ORF-105 peptide [Chrysodeixis chalcites nucleopolyhedrovirus]AGC36319.1 hypothetical protein TF1A_00105 [Chrysodeixis chalcites SNPV TF1-A]AAY84036.1 ORF-105 peptide [Chrysodeixis chalcites nucleopolyhedrovirus]AGE61366.1 hypothetical protein [Chrysodeixis chalcites nucleopolyhedrovirus]AGE61511.1 hypothetical protein [Chrysodeixis chalcites nucleopolyhedrovirus]AGE61665.1 hypothetical protein [Chrysodeixis chalcites nucleopolyhedrovirus]